MKLTVLGMNGPYPEPGKACSGYLVTDGDTHIQLDAGCGTLARLTGLTPPETLSAVLLSHWHNDHVSDLLPMIYRLQAAGAVLDLYAPADEASPVRQIVASSGVFRVHDLSAGDTVQIGSVRLSAGPARHPVPALSLRLENTGNVLCYTGDTNTVDGLEDFVRGCRLLLADALFPAETWSENKPHLSATLAAELASACRAEKLILTHLSPAFDSLLLLREAQKIFRNARLAQPGLVVE